MPPMTRTERPGAKRSISRCHWCLREVVERDGQQVLEGGAAGAAREGLGDAGAAALGVAHLGDEGEDVLLAAQVVLVAAGLGQERLEAAERLRQQGPVGVEVAAGDLGQRRRAVAAGAEADLAAGAVLEEDLAVGRLEAGPELGAGAALALEGGEGELDVLAGAEGVGGEVGAGAEVVADAGAAHLDAVGVLALRVGDLEGGEERVFADVLEAEVLLEAELPAQLDLPVLQRHAVRLVQPRQLGRLAPGGPGGPRPGAARRLVVRGDVRCRPFHHVDLLRHSSPRCQRGPGQTRVILAGSGPRGERAGRRVPHPCRPPAASRH
jgi:hypothetical protein